MSRKLFSTEYIKNYEIIYENEHEIPYRSPGTKWIKEVNSLLERYNTQDLLDYGCGVCELQDELPFEITKYDPAIPEYAAHPTRSHDVVICADVLEHIEPDCIDDVLDDLRNLTKKGIFLNIARNKAGKILADGRNAHLLVKPVDWWLGKLKPRFEILSCDVSYREISIFAEPKEQ